MGKLTRLLRALYGDGLKALSIFSPLLSIAFTLAKIFDAVPLLRGIAYGWAFLPLTIWLLVAYVRRWAAYEEQVELPRPAPLTLTPMSAWDIAGHLLNRSCWGWRTYSELNFWEFVSSAVPEEMRRAGFAAEVRYIGTRPNEQTAEEIDRTYWNYATVDEIRIWDRRNGFFSVQRSNLTPSVRGGVIHYQFGAAPRIDVMRTWPSASLTQKLTATLRVAWRKTSPWKRTICAVLLVCTVVLLGFAAWWFCWR